MERGDIAKFEIAAKGVNKLAEKSNPSDIINYIEDFRESKNGKKLRESFSKLSEKDKMNLYKDGGLNVAKYLKTTLAMGSIGRIQSALMYESKKLKAFGPEVSTFYRFLVHMGVVDKPLGLTREECIKNTKKDAKFINIYISVAQVGCMAFAPEAEPFLTALKPVVKTLSTKAVEISEKQQESMNKNNEKIEKIEKETKIDLAESFENIQKKSA